MIKPGMFISERYEIIDKVGSGGMADVYKAKCHRLNRYVAIKILKPEYSGDKSFVAKFRAEAQSAAGLSHPNIVNVYDVGNDDGLYYIVMELVEGITLKRFIERKGKLEIKESVGIAIQIAQGMEAAHSNHIIHRDIKPQNIIISRDGKVKVTDFGIAKAATSNTVTQNAIGSVHYLSPEQARGGYSDEKSDIYSLGVTLYEMLTGRVPFSGDTTVSVAILHLQSEAVPVRELNPEIPISVDKIVQKCMQKKPERRYLSASELIADLKRSIQQPDGEFVTFTASAVDDSPTIHIPDNELDQIRSGTKVPVTYNSNNQEKEIKKVEPEEEEDLTNYGSKTDKFLMAGAVTMAIILGIAVLYLVSKFFGLFDFLNKENTGITPTPIISGELSPTPPITPTSEPEKTDKVVVMPGVVGDELQKAIETLKGVSSDFVIDYSAEEYSTEHPKGYVIKQYPLADTDIISNSEIRLTISAGPELKTVPFTYGNTAEKAEQILRDAGYVVGEKKYENSEDYNKDMVIRTIPESGKSLLLGEKVDLVISLGSNKSLVEVPMLLGKTQTEALLAVTENDLKLGDPIYIQSEAYEEGQVCFQSTSAGEKVAPGTVIDISISTGSATPTPTPEPEENTTPTPTQTPEPTKVLEPTQTPDPTQTPEPTKPPVYKGSVTIDNPFAEGDSPGEIILELTWDDGNGGSSSKTIVEKDMTYEELAANSVFYFTGEAPGPAVVTMYVNGVAYEEYLVELRES